MIEIAPSGVTRIAGAYAYAEKLANCAGTGGGAAAERELGVRARGPRPSHLPEDHRERPHPPHRLAEVPVPAVASSLAPLRRARPARVSLHLLQLEWSLRVRVVAAWSGRCTHPRRGALQRLARDHKACTDECRGREREEDPYGLWIASLFRQIVDSHLLKCCLGVVEGRDRLIL